jgi:hypothetical protein
VLYFAERNRVPTTVERRVPVEVVKEVPKEVIKEVAKPSTPEEIRAREFYADAVKASQRGIVSNSLTEMKAMELRIGLDSTAKEALDEEVLRTKVELELRRDGIEIDPKATATVIVSVSAMKDIVGKELVGHYILARLAVKFPGLLIKDSGKMEYTSATIWTTGQQVTLGTKGEDKEEYIVKALLEKFSNAWLEANPRK